MQVIDINPLANTEGCTKLSTLSIDCQEIGTWFSGLTSIKEIEIGENTTSIAESAFANCTGIESVTIGKNVTSIGYSAFSRCSNLKSVISMIEDPYWIDVSVFQYSLTSNTTLYVPTGKKELYKDKSCWNQFPSFEEFSDEWDTSIDMTIEILSEIDKTVQIGNGKEAAISASITEELVVPSKVTRYGKTYTVVSLADSAFYACNKLTSVEIPSSIKSSGKDAFSGCSGLKKVIVSDLKAWCAIAFSVKSSNPLYYAKHLYSDANTEITDLVIPEGVAKINAYAFIKGSFKTVSIPSSVTDINSHSFYKCTSLTSANMAKGVGKIHTNAFYGCTALTSVTLPEGMTRIGTSSFYQCTALEEIELPASISEIATTAFKLCSNLKQVTSSILSPKAFGTESFASISADCKLYIPVGTLPKYHSVGWTKDVFAGGIVEVGDVEVNYNIENGVTADFIKNVVYPNDDYSFTKITDYTTVATSYRKDLPQPVRIEAPITNDGKALVLETYSNGVLVRSDNFLVGQRALEIWNLIPQTQYTYKLYLVADDNTKSKVSQGSFKTEGQVRMMKIDNVRNFRDIGGWELPNGKYIKYDKIFRCAELAESSPIITDTGIQELLSVQGVGVEIDFGNTAGSPVSSQLDYDYFKMSSFYSEGLKKEGANFKQGFEKTVQGLREGKKVIFHCNAGADRTGAFAFLLEGLLGVSESDLAKDYELTSFVYDNRYRNAANWKGMIEYVKKNFSGNTLNEKIEQMATESFGISPTDINDFRSLMIAYKEGKVVLSKSKATVAVGKSGTLKASVYPETLEDKSVTWKSSNKKVATVTSKGKVTAVGVGTATITCTSVATGAKATCKVTVGKIVLSKSEAIVPVGKSGTLKATVYPTTLADKSLTWKSSDTKVATVTSKGKVKAVGVGTAIITCTYATGLSATCTLTVGKVVLSKSEATVKVGKSGTLKATVYPETLADKSVTWKSSDTQVATVTSKGKVTAVGVGTAIITCTSNTTGLKATCTLTVGKVVLSKTKATVSVGKSGTLRATVYPETLEDKSVTWKSSDTKVAKVTTAGRVTAVGAGTAIITCTSNATGLSATCTLTVTATVAGTRSLGEEDDEMRGFEDMDMQPAVIEPFDVYDLNGRKVLSQVTSLDGLPRGIYIVNGKKVMKQ